MSEVSFFLPTRKGSQRVVNKNTKPFAGFSGGILELKLTQLLECRKVDEIILSTNDEVSMEVASKFKHEKRLKIIERPDHLCLDTTALADLIRYVPSVVTTEHIIWGHVTTPFADAGVYDHAITQYFEALKAGFDSLISVSILKNFLLNKEGKIINYAHSGGRWPRTQDLEPVFEVNHAVFMTSKKTYIEKNDRIGPRPFLLEMDHLHSVDIDWEEDFLIAEALYDRFFKI